MKNKFKITENTTLNDIKDQLDYIKTLSVKELELNSLRKIINYLGAEEVLGVGSKICFRHEILLKHPFYHGNFTVHKIHKGGSVELITMIDYKSYLYKALLEIIKLKENEIK